MESIQERSQEPASKTTRETILDVGETLLKQHGYHGFSYAHIAQEVNIKKPSIHHHFPTKATLVETIISRYQEMAITRLGTPEDMTLEAALTLLQHMYQGALDGPGQGCLCATLASNWTGLPDEVKVALYTYRKAMIDWIGRVIMTALKCSPARADRAATWVLTLFEGAVTSARVHEQPHYLNDAPRTAHATILALV